MISDTLREKVTELIENKITVEELEKWMVPQLPILAADPDSDDADMTSAIELGLAEMSDNIRSYDEFIHYLREVLQEKAELVIKQPATITSSTGENVFVPFSFVAVQVSSSP